MLEGEPTRELKGTTELLALEMISGLGEAIRLETEYLKTLAAQLEKCKANIRALSGQQPQTEFGLELIDRLSERITRAIPEEMVEIQKRIESNRKQQEAAQKIVDKARQQRPPETDKIQ
jgi:hypothetical protein